MSEIRCELELQGRLQGVGFRPLAFRLARELGLSGWVRNTTQGVTLALQGLPGGISEFERRITEELPAHAAIRRCTRRSLPLSRETDFRIAPSTASGGQAAELLPDLATCAACTSEVLDPQDRRYRYPFTSCTDCGPRYSVLCQLPYDRGNTTMSQFAMCAACQTEYADPENRRFHAQTNCCAQCGPQLFLKRAGGELLAQGDQALRQAAAALAGGELIAVMGLGGFHLFCDARSDSAVGRLRQAKARCAKPFAVMVRDLAHARRLCTVSDLEAGALRSRGAPIVLMSRRRDAEPEVCAAVAPELPDLGLMLAYTPLHLLLLHGLEGAAVATSGNLADEPLCIMEGEARERLGRFTDLFLGHDRPIAARVDDSVVRIIAGTQVVLRAGRGYAPLLLPAPEAAPSDGGEPRASVGLGPHQKSTFSLARGGQIVLFPHVGTLDTRLAVQAYRESLARSLRLCGIAEVTAVCDLHPDYATTRLAAELSTQPLAVQHHHAHVLSCAAEHQLREPYLGVAWDGTGYGGDGTIWGGEFLRSSASGLLRAGTLRPFRLIGGDAAAREPRRAALGLLYELYGDDCAGRVPGFTKSELGTLLRALSRGLNAPKTSSIGRLFDGVAALLGRNLRAEYEGQAAILLEAAARDSAELPEPPPYPLRLSAGPPIVLDWEPWIRGILDDAAGGQSVAVIAARFHATLAAAIVAVAQRIGLPQVVLSGGCFQNPLLCQRAVALLRAAGFHPYWNQRVPPNDGGISVGQAAAGLRR